MQSGGVSAGLPSRRADWGRRHGRRAVPAVGYAEIVLRVEVDGAGDMPPGEVFWVVRRSASTTSCVTRVRPPHEGVTQPDGRLGRGEGGRNHRLMTAAQGLRSAIAALVATLRNSLHRLPPTDLQRPPSKTPGCNDRLDSATIARHTVTCGG
jgi:hypothetical protein